jgi:adenylate cyclase
MTRDRLNLSAFFAEIQRRRIWRWAFAYVAGAWAFLQFADLVGDRFGWPDVWLRWLIVIVGVGFCATLVVAWYHGERAAQRVSVIEAGMLTALFAIAGIALYAVGPSEDSATPQEVPEQANTATRALPSVVHSAESAQAPHASIAVLPFQNMSSDPEQAYFSDGLTEELLNLLAQVSELRVAARTSAFAFKGKQETVDVIGKTLRVAHIVEGSVRKSGDRIRITVQLIDARSGFHRWSQTYDRDLHDVFAVQDEISRAIVEELRVRVADARGAISKTNEPEAYSLFLKGTQALQKSGAPRDYLSEAERAFSDALKIDPGYPAALSGLGTTIRSQAYYQLIPVKEGYARAREYARRALQLNPRDWNAHGELAIISDWFDRDYLAAEQHYRRAIELNSSASRLGSYYGWLLMRLGRTAEALNEGQRAVDIDPLSISARSNLASLFMYARQPERAVIEYKAALALDANDVITLGNLALAYSDVGDVETAVTTAERALTLDPDFPFAQSGAAYCYALAGRRADAEKLLDALEKQEAVSPYLIATVHVALGNDDEVFRYLNIAVEEADDGVVDLGMDPMFDPLRDDPRMDSLLERLKLKAATAANE